MACYATSIGHVLAELERIDLQIQMQVARARQLQVADDQFQGLVITEAEVDALMASPAGLPRWAADPSVPSMADVQGAVGQISAAIAQRAQTSLRQGVVLRLEVLARLFNLCPLDVDALLICIAPELDLRYERLYGYLQDDITKKHPSVDLVLNLLAPSYAAKLAARQRFTPQAPLIRHELLHLFDDPSLVHPPLLSQSLKADERVVAYLLDADDLDAHLLPYARIIRPRVSLAELMLPETLKRRLALLAQTVRGQPARHEPGLVLYFQGPYGVGKQTTAEALCSELGMGLLVVDGASLLQTEGLDFGRMVRLAMREALLQQAALYWAGYDALLTDDRRPWLDLFWRELAEQPGWAFLTGEATWEPVDSLARQPFLRVEFTRPAHDERLRLWNASLDGCAGQLAAADLAAVATKFRFSGGQIRDATATARNLAHWRDPQGGQVSLGDLYAACRLQSNRNLAALAHKIEPHYTWGDIVLPPDRLDQLREICNQVRYRARVYGEWGFDHKLSLGKGLNVLFAGPSGTGKTMAAEIIARELGLDLYKIDLSTVVSKYIGETEKNLARIFAEAETSNAILFFDEADALFGKRSEVHDAHDRYANIEISYLLQKMEEYEGVTILATNLRKNLDEAFVRRMHFMVDFPLPNEADRRRIWEGIWPRETPRSRELDLGLMARRFELAGGNIRNIALAAAFLAADDGQNVTMNHLFRATKREYQKMGKVLAEGELEVRHAEP